jgi:hypothetical protein
MFNNDFFKAFNANKQTSKNDSKLIEKLEKNRDAVSGLAGLAPTIRTLLEVATKPLSTEEAKVIKRAYVMFMIDIIGVD